MVGLKSLFVALASVSAVFAAPATDLAVRASGDLVKRTTITTSTTGTAGGYYYSCYIEGNTGATLDVETGSYKLTWQTSSQDVVAGIGWATGAARYSMSHALFRAVRL